MYPIPFVAPSISATTIAINPEPLAIFIPSSTDIKASGIFILKKTCRLVAPLFLAASIMSSSTAASPAMVEEMIGYIEFQMITNILGASPIPISTINSGKSATEGTFFVEFTIGMISLFKFSYIEQRTAIVNPTTKAIAIPVRTILKVYKKHSINASFDNSLAALCIIAIIDGSEGLFLTCLAKQYADIPMIRLNTPLSAHIFPYFFKELTIIPLFTLIFLS